MTGFSRGALVGATLAVAAVVALASTANAQPAQHRTAHKKIHAPAPADAQPLPPGVDLQTSTAGTAGADNHYFTDTVASGDHDLKDMSYRYGQTTTGHYDAIQPLFRF